MKIIFVTILLFLFDVSQSQPVVVYKRQTNFYNDFVNVVQFLAKNLDCSSIVFKTDNGKIEQRDCWLSYIPERPGPTTFKIYERRKSRLVLIDSIQINVFENTNPQVYLGNKTQGSISKKMMIAMGGIIAKMEVIEGHSEPIAVQGYTVIIHKANGSIISEQNTGNRYSEKLVQLFQDLQAGEKVSFINIKVKLFDGREINARPIEFAIEEDEESKK